MTRNPLQLAAEHDGLAGGGAARGHHERLEELLADRALFGLSPKDEAELLGLLDAARQPLDDSFEMTAAALDRALCPATEPMPAALQAQVLAAGQAWAAQRRAEERADTMSFTAHARRAMHGPSERIATGDGARRLGWRAWGGWLAAAACLALAIISWNRSGSILSPGPDGPGDNGARAGVPNLDALWSQLSGEPTAKAAELEKKDDTVGPPPIAAAVYWSDDRQTGVLRLKGLPPIRCPGDVYQVWITDALRDEQYPVDGGMFRVEDGQSEVLLLIKPRVRVDCAVHFTITRERAGGAVVSDARAVVASGGVSAGKR